ncbi:Hypothetical predicted protein [Marmota monax]|uniref:Uncharacterized protein n=1 Tax=Marmota monax TaxID=9995 RepID=A0A5E4CWI0_MARMO|nr:Hypothetical predicted protein [Marmota monax]
MAGNQTPLSQALALHTEFCGPGVRPRKKYPETQTESQEIGWEAEPLVSEAPASGSNGEERKGVPEPCPGQSGAAPGRKTSPGGHHSQRRAHPKSRRCGSELGKQGHMEGRDSPEV